MSYDQWKLATPPQYDITPEQEGELEREELYDRIARLVSENEWLREALKKAADIARNGCLVNPDGGSPTEDERAICETIADSIAALATTPEKGEGE